MSRWLAPRLILLALAVGTGACASLRVPSSAASSEPGVRQVVTGGATFFVTYEPQDAAAAQQVVVAIERAVPALARWGSFTGPVTVRVHPTHEALEAAVRRFDYPWLRAWARFDTVDLQSPRTWGLLPTPTEHVVELLTHELTHCLMYQQAGTADDWMHKEIPLWFREGMASVTARQGYRRPSDEDIWRWLRTFPDKDPVGDADSLYQGEAEIVYGSAHRAFEFLAQRYGDRTVVRLLERMKAGASFGNAFTRELGVTPTAFEQEYLRYVRWEGWRGRRPRPQVVRPKPTRAPSDGAGGEPGL